MRDLRCLLGWHAINYFDFPAQQSCSRCGYRPTPKEFIVMPSQPPPAPEPSERWAVAGQPITLTVDRQDFAAVVLALFDAQWTLLPTAVPVQIDASNYELTIQPLLPGMYFVRVTGYRAQGSYESTILTLHVREPLAADC